jgi:uncharacterized membrane protein YccC
VKRLTPYQKRQRAGKLERAKFLKYRHQYQHLATLFSGFAVGGTFVLIMGFARGYQTPTEILFAFTLTAFVGLMLIVREYFVIKSSWKWWKIKVN